ncbi:hypothetical protein OESDEN_01854 [Oesophagostomum dentatum]|uniref:Uncharacterized protein n=1 Tax=Oesophagostomum dentatum TaxID=61180 RepID=A0A0B1TS29_OESDE|nr:hypothetical protein OESDEN_01854 [Oesophagostomum dentatum]
MVVDGSRMFAGNPGLPYTASYGSGQFEASLFEQAVHFGLQIVLRDRFIFFKETSHSEEGFLLDDDEDSSILSNLPNSCHDFELKELHIRLERNHSSPLIGGHCSPAVSSLLSSKCPSTEPPADPAEPEDLEVQLINECFEEQQRQNQMYQSGDLKTLFYHGSSEIDPSKVKTCINLLVGNVANRPGAENRVQSPTERPVRLPYAKKLSSQDTFLSGAAHYDSRPTTDTFSSFNENFEPLLTLQSEALVEKKAKKESRTSSNRRRVSEPLTHPSFWNAKSALVQCSKF